MHDIILRSSPSLIIQVHIILRSSPSVFMQSECAKLFSSLEFYFPCKVSLENHSFPHHLNSAHLSSLPSADSGFHYGLVSCRLQWTGGAGRQTAETGPTVVSIAEDSRGWVGHQHLLLNSAKNSQ